MKKIKNIENNITLEKKLVIEKFCNKFIFTDKSLISNSYKSFPISYTYFKTLQKFYNITDPKGFSNYSSVYTYKNELLKISFKYLELNKSKIFIESNLIRFNNFFLLQFKKNKFEFINFLEDMKINFETIKRVTNNTDNFFSNNIFERSYYFKMNKKLPKYF